MTRILLFDSYDSFTYNLKDYLEQGGAHVEVVKNDAMSLEEIIQLKPEGVVISPGPQKPDDSGNLMAVLAYFYNRIPILGVCLGHQAIGQFFGFKLVKAPLPVHGKLSEIEIVKDEIFEQLPQKFKVCRYHSLILGPRKSNDIRIIAQTQDGIIMAIRHTSMPIWGVQYHPEAILTQFGHTLISNWLKVVTLQRH